MLRIPPPHQRSSLANLWVITFSFRWGPFCRLRNAAKQFNSVFSLRILLSSYYITLLILSMNHLTFSNIIFVTRIVNTLLRKPQSGERTVMGKLKTLTSPLLVPFICPKQTPYTKILYVIFLLVLLIIHTASINPTSPLILIVLFVVPLRKQLNIFSGFVLGGRMFVYNTLLCCDFLPLLDPNGQTVIYTVDGLKTL